MLVRKSAPQNLTTIDDMAPRIKKFIPLKYELGEGIGDRIREISTTGETSISYNFLN